MNVKLHTVDRRITLALILTSLLMWVSGCSTLSKEECQSADWQLIGFEDGTQGFLLQRIGEHRKACAEYGIAPRMDAYERGHQRGVLSYCTEANGLLVGKRGREYNGVCPADLAPPFLFGHQKGMEIHNLAARVRQLAKQVEQKQVELFDVEEHLHAVEESLVATGVSVTERRALLDELRSLELSQQEGNRELDQLLDEKLSFTRQLHTLNNPHH
ncbi:hypothetical protein A9Q99_06375 [Gammaproteobacteria bacterium 45_16_T64]|nr:hypothetical protein A9Q99_06375 [Gammaproteobacteria bacterium 45_16_T64]